MRCINYLSEYLVPVVLFYIVGFAVLQKRPVFDDFIEGALAGLKTVAGILPTLVGLMAAVGVLLSISRENGARIVEPTDQQSGGRA